MIYNILDIFQSLFEYNFQNIYIAILLHVLINNQQINITNIPY